MINLQTLDNAVHLLLDGQVGVVPSDTVYGLMACAHNEQAVKHLYSLKHRERKPGPIIAASVEQLIALSFNEQALRRVTHWWPGSLSVIIPVTRTKTYLDQGLGSQPVRIPRDAWLREFLTKTGPLVTSSANQPGEPPATTIGEAYNYFGDTVDFYVDAGDTSGRIPSTIIRISPSGEIEVLREGAVKINATSA